MKMTVKKTSLFPAKQRNVFELLKRFDTLVYIAKPYAEFESIDGQTELVWEVGRSLRYLDSLRLVFMLLMSRNSTRTTFIQRRAILFAPYGIIELFLKKLLMAKRNILTR